MRFRARKTLRLGPLRLHFTQSGFSSWGVKVGPWTWNARPADTPSTPPGPAGSSPAGGDGEVPGERPTARAPIRRGVHRLRGEVRLGRVPRRRPVRGLRRGARLEPRRRVVTALDLDDTSRCPLGHRCESCGVERDDLTVATATTPLGVLCLTLCPRCASATTAPPVGVGTANRLVLAHCEHLGIDADQMAAAMERDQ